MHNICEGVTNYDLCHIIKYYIENSVFTLAHLNSLIQNFSFASVFASNKPPIMKLKKLGSYDLGFNANEINACFGKQLLTDH